MFRKLLLIVFATPTFCFSQGIDIPGASKSLNSWTIDVAKTEAIGRGVKRFQTAHSKLGYQVLIEYDPSFFSNEWSGREQVFANHDTYYLTMGFVRLLLKKGIDPSSSQNPQKVKVCAYEGGLVSPTGKPQYTYLGCSEYEPSTDSISTNDNSD